ncbi:CrcB family protein [Arthrobacter sp. 1P04PC]|uniref:fluoride efflux transporter FluC n=1 Tax=unclassified Arthrobacter TaxID=235627 RepID=UPI0039A07BEB
MMEPPLPGTTASARTLAAAGDENLLPTDSGPVESITVDVDPDAETLGEPRAHRPVHLHPGLVLVVMAGGFFGALARYGLSALLPSPGSWPLPTLVINLAGAFLLGGLLEALVRRGPDAGRRRITRLLAGTGFMGAFTTYSTLALETNTLLDSGRVTDALLYLAATLAGGAGATLAGIWFAASHHTRATTRHEAGL